MINIGVTVTSKSFNDKWPKLKIYFNDCLIDTVSCEQITTLNYQVPLQQGNLLSIELFDKNFGDNNLWDVDSNGQGLEATVTDITLDDVSIGHLMSSLKFTTKWTPAQLQYLTKEFIDKHSEYCSNGLMSFNGALTFEFWTPVYDFLIDKKYKIPYNPDLAFYSNKTELFHYESGLEIIKEIKKIISAHD